jgi:glycosyl transferase family 25
MKSKSSNTHHIKYIAYGILLLLVMFIATFLSTILKKKEGFDQEIRPPLSLENTQPYLIHLAKNTERLQTFTQSYENTDLNAVTFHKIDAIYGLDIPYEKFISKTQEGDTLTPGMVGCYLSHLKTYNTFLASNKEYAFIFEDDAKITNPYIYEKTLTKLVDIIPSNWDIILIGYFNYDPTHIFQDKQTYYDVFCFWGLHGYLVNRKSAQLLLDKLQPPFTKQIDHDIGFLAKSGELNIYAIKSAEVIQAAKFTDVQTR